MGYQTGNCFTRLRCYMGERVDSEEAAQMRNETSSKKMKTPPRKSSWFLKKHLWDNNPAYYNLNSQHRDTVILHSGPLLSQHPTSEEWVKDVALKKNRCRKAIYGYYLAFAVLQPAHYPQSHLFKSISSSTFHQRWCFRDLGTSFENKPLLMITAFRKDAFAGWVGCLFTPNQHKFPKKTNPNHTQTCRILVAEIWTG